MAGAFQDMALEITPQFFYDYENSAYFGQLMYSRVASSIEIDPDAKGTGQARTAILVAGVRSDNFDSFDFRYRIGAIDMDLIRTPLSMGLTLLDFDKTGFLETDMRWVNLRLGPSLYLGNERSHIALRGVGIGGLSTIKMGNFYYAGVNALPDITNRKRSYEVGYKGEIRVLIANRLSIQAYYQHRNQLGGARPQMDTIQGLLGVHLSDTASLLLNFLATKTNIGTSDIYQRGVGFNFNLTY